MESLWRIVVAKYGWRGWRVSMNSREREEILRINPTAEIKNIPSSQEYYIHYPADNEYTATTEAVIALNCN